MNFNQIEKFFQVISENPSLKQQIASTENLKQVIKIAHQSGYYFTPLEFNNFLAFQQESKLEFPQQVTETQLKRWWKFAWENLDISLLYWIQQQQIFLNSSIILFSNEPIKISRKNNLFPLFKKIVIGEIIIGTVLLMFVLLILL